MNFNSVRIVLIINCIFFCGCLEMQKEISFDDQFKPNLILHGYFSPQDGIDLIVKKAIPPNQVDNNDTVVDAKVYVHKNMEDYIELHSSNNYTYTYKNTGFITEGELYYIRVITAEFGEVISDKELIMSKPKIDSISINQFEIGHFFLHLEFNNIYAKKYGYSIMYKFFRNGDVLEYNEDNSYPKFSFSNSINDVKIGKNIVDTDIPLYYDEFDSIMVDLYLLSPNFQEFITSSDNYEYTRGDPFFPRTYPIFTNINKGKGIWGAYNYASKVFNISYTEDY